MNTLARILSWLAGKVTAVILIIAALVGGYLLHAWVAPPEPKPEESAEARAPKDEEPELWTCSMHPQIQLPKPGQCPICEMDLVPVEPGAGRGPRTFVTSRAAAKLMELQTRPVERRFVTATVRLPGKVTYDETRLAAITAWVGGRIDRLYVDYTGITVRKGDHMAYLYSPELLSAQEELLQAKQAAAALADSDLAAMRETARATVEAAREKLRLLGLTDAQVRAVEERGKATDHVTLYAPSGGIVVEKHLEPGAYVRTGTRIYTLADLRRVWVKLDAYEADLPWLRYGQPVQFNTKSYPGETFTGKIAFIAPVVNEKTRTVKVRVNVPNPELKLKPDMFVTGVVRAKVAAGGRVMEPDLAGKWMCPMHPSVVKDGPAHCDVCGMPLARTESLGYVPVDADRRDTPLVVPVSAPLITGERAVVYVRDPKAERPTFVGRVITLGPRAGDYYIVRDGLAEGEEVVTRGNFKIDSALQIQAKKSMMSIASEEAEAPPEERPKPVRAPEDFQTQLGAAVRAYFGLSDALAADSRKGAEQGARTLQDSLEKVDAGPLADPARAAWETVLKKIRRPLGNLAKADTLEDMRAVFAGLSDAMIEAVDRFSVAGVETVYRLHCPMAFGNVGADWLQADQTTRNPYYGPKILRCGSITATLHETKAPAAFQRRLGGVVKAYFTLSGTLASDDFGAASKAARSAREALAKLDGAALGKPLQEAWRKEKARLKKAAGEAAKAKDLAGLRSAFALLSDELAAVIRQFGVADVDTVYRLHCPMAFNNRGADWLQSDREVRNPYYGAQMLQCGEVVETMVEEGDADG
jgi:Cu(I)/Ag(I) efflux system membrane fusion protein